MDTDSYYLFFSKQATFIRLQELAGNLGYRIDYAKICREKVGKPTF